MSTEIIKDMPIGGIKVDPQTRIRQPEDLHMYPRYMALKKSMIEDGQLVPIIININYKLIDGFLRFNVAIELNWDTIKVIIVDVSNEGERRLEFTANYNRKNYTDYEEYRGLALWKRAYEEAYPETKRGGYLRSFDPKSKVHRNALMLSFVERYHEVLGIQKRALYNKIRIGEAILQDQFDKDIIKLLEQGTISQSRLLQILKGSERKLVVSSIPEEVQDQKKSPKTKNKIKEKRPLRLPSKKNNTFRTNSVKTNKKKIRKEKEEQEKKEELCIECNKARASACPNCLNQFILCLNDLEKGHFVLKKADSKKCKEFEFYI